MIDRVVLWRSSIDMDLSKRWLGYWIDARQAQTASLETHWCGNDGQRDRSVPDLVYRVEQ